MPGTYLSDSYCRRSENFKWSWTCCHEIPSTQFSAQNTPKTIDHICDTSYLAIDLQHQTNYHNLAIIPHEVLLIGFSTTKPSSESNYQSNIYNTT